MPKLIKGLVPLFNLLSSKRAGETVTTDELIAVTGWAASTPATYVRKRKFTGLLAPTNMPGEFRVLVDGAVLREEDVAAALTQVTERPMPIVRDEEVVGARDRYVLIDRCGEGAVGQVWRARAVRTNAMVAVKLCNPRPDLLEPAIVDDVRDRFRREHRFGSAIGHACIVEYRDHGEHNGMPFLVMELAEDSVAAELRGRGRLSVLEVIRIADRVGQGLMSLHERGLVHRDVKPANILRVARGYILGDLGIVRWGDMSKSFTGAGTLTRAAVQLGSWLYMAPEQQESPHHATAASDVYAFAITCIELLSGIVPNPARVAARKVEPPCDVAAMNELLTVMTSYDAGERPSMTEVMRQLGMLRARLDDARASVG